jgi:hypothetical protein
MNGVYLEVFAIGITIALSPITIIATILMLLPPRGRSVGLAFLSGWVAGLVVVTALLIRLAGSAGVRDESRGTSSWADGAQLALGCLLLLVGVMNWRRRGQRTTTALPAWTRMIDRMNPFLAAGLGMVWAGPSPKNLVLLSAAAVSIVEANLRPRQEVAADITLAIGASLGVAVPVVWAFYSGERALKRLTLWREWLVTYNATIMAIVLIAAGTLLTAKSINSLVR